MHIHSQIWLILLGFIFGFISNIAHGEDPTLDAASILDEINARGVKPVFDRLYKNGKWSTFINHIESGNRLWLEVAVLIKSATDAGPSEMLHLAAGVALASAPHDVLLLTIPALPIEGVCGFPDMTDPRYNTKQKTLSYLDARINTVILVKESDVALKRGQCLKILEDTRKEIISPIGPFSSN